MNTAEPGSVARRAATLIIMSLATLAACGGVSERDRELLDIWLTCEECSAGELDSIMRIGDRIVPRHSTALMDGPSDDAQQNYELQLREIYGERAARAQRNPDIQIRITESEFVERFLGNFVALYRVRAGHALAQIGVPDAAAALADAAEAARQGHFRDDVAEEVKRLDSALVR